jgi:molybdenum cofactor biosynthesis enzyme
MNLNPDSVLNRLSKYTVKLGELNREFVKLSVDLANKEAEYRKAKAKKIMLLKNDGMSVTLIADLVKGDDSVAMLMLARDLAKALVEAKRIEIYSVRDCISVEQSSLNWLKVEYNSGGNQ